jgi:hypothetical protein
MALHQIDPQGLTDDALMLALRAMEQGLSRRPSGYCKERHGYRDRALRDSGMALAAEAWDRGLISAPAPEKDGGAGGAEDAGDGDGRRDTTRPRQAPR